MPEKRPQLRQYIQLNPGYYDENGQFIPGGVVQCPFSDEMFNVTDSDNLNIFLKHLIENYRLVIGDVKLIADFQQYIYYWTGRFQQASNGDLKNNVTHVLTQFCTTIQTNPLDKESASETYYFLSDDLPEDKQLRQTLQISRLEYVLAQQESERNSYDISFKCFFCRYRWDKVNRSEVILHLAQCHKFNIGHPDNIVFAKEFLNKLRGLFDSFTCPCCKKTFKDKTTLLDHMKKKGHKKLDPDDFSFDKFYVINYLEPGRSWKEHQEEIKVQEQLAHQLKREAKKMRAKKEELENNPQAATNEANNNSEFNVEAPVFIPKNLGVDSGKAETGDSEEVDTDNEETWDEQPDYTNQVYISLFCDSTFQTSEECLKFMTEKHNFDLNELSKRANFNFYDRIKIINYIRRVVAEGKMEISEILTSIGKREWDSIQFLFPTFENDQLLYSFESNDCEVEMEEDGSGDTIGSGKSANSGKGSSGIQVDGKSKGKSEKIVVLAEEQPDAALIRSTSILKNLVLDD